MTSAITSRIAKHVLKENAKNHFGTEDPYFDYVTPHDLNGNPRKVKRTKKAAPPGITTTEAKILKKVTRRAYRLDNCFSVCGIRVGWSAIFGIIPGLGDVFDVLMALMVYRTCCQADIPSSLRTRMMVNIMLDFGIGLVPILGDVADAVFRANTRNAALLYAHLKERGAVRLEGGGVVEEDKVERGGGHHGSGVGGREQIMPPPSAPAPAHVHDANGQTSGTVVVGEATDRDAEDPRRGKSKTESKGGWLSRFTAGGSTAPVSKKEPDLEAGERV